MSTPAISARVASFVSDLEGLVRKAALEAVQAALGGPATARSAPSSAPARKATAKAPTAKPAPSKPAPWKPATRVRRSPEDVAASARAIKAHLASNPGQGVEAIAKALGVPSKDLALPIINLLGAKSIRKEGQKRGTRYFVAGASEGKAAIAPAPAKVEAKPAKGKAKKK